MNAYIPQIRELKIADSFKRFNVNACILVKDERVESVLHEGRRGVEDLLERIVQTYAVGDRSYSIKSALRCDRPRSGHQGAGREIGGFRDIGYAFVYQFSG